MTAPQDAAAAAAAAAAADAAATTTNAEVPQQAPPQAPAPAPRVVSLLPSATEIVASVGGAGLLVGRSHECDFPDCVRGLPVLTAAKTKFESSQQMHDAVVATLTKDGDAGMGLYTVDAALMQELAPTVIVTQSLCDVCSVDMRLVERLCGSLAPRPQIISLNPFSLDEVLADCRTVGAALGLEAGAAAAVAALEARVAAVRRFVTSQPPLRLGSVGWMEWTEPIFCAGHWTPQLIAMAGGSHPLNPATPETGAGKSRAVHNDEFVASDPDWIVVAPCGFDMAQTKRELARITDQDWWTGLRAVREGRVALVDGNQMFNRPGPRLVDALEFLTGLLHGRHELIPPGFPWDMWRPEAAGGGAGGDSGGGGAEAAAAEAARPS